MTERICRPERKDISGSKLTGHAGFSPELKPCCRGIPLSRLWPGEVFSVHVNKSLCQSGF